MSIYQSIKSAGSVLFSKRTLPLYLAGTIAVSGSGCDFDTVKPSSDYDHARWASVINTCSQERSPPTSYRAFLEEADFFNDSWDFFSEQVDERNGYKKIPCNGLVSLPDLNGDGFVLGVPVSK